MPRASPATQTPVPRPTRRGGGAPGRHINVGAARSRGKDTSLPGNAEGIDEDKPLTDAQRRFVQLWASGESIVTASARAGYDGCPTYGYRLVRQPNVLKLYNEEKAKFEASCQMTRKRVMDGLIEGVEMAKLAGEPASVISGWREIGKMCGYYEPVTRKLDITVNGDLAMDRMNRLSDAELLRLIQDGISADLEQIEHQN